ncbi:MAG: hypothetical protein ABS34_02870 [Opitutaceae bacterium BACL24 MAG-120322-bin51]|nr:MAG: hypothetical protein ABS34_02870 [Opitutaceae bacterium BACL24 MAG-120322-bin51]
MCAFSEWREVARLILPCPSCFAVTFGEQLGSQVVAPACALHGRASLRSIIKSQSFPVPPAMADTLFLSHLSKFFTRQAIKLRV